MSVNHWALRGACAQFPGRREMPGARRGQRRGQLHLMEKSGESQTRERKGRRRWGSEWWRVEGMGRRGRKTEEGRGRREREGNRRQEGAGRPMF